MRNLLLTAAATAATAAVGTIAAGDTRSAWYRRLRKPAFQPPPAAFPIAWTLLYADVAISTAVVLDDLEDANGGAADLVRFRAALVTNLVLNGSWTWVFFKGHHLGPATVVAAALTASSADLVRRAAPTSPSAAIALAPYAAWCGFATVLSGRLWQLNR